METKTYPTITLQDAFDRNWQWFVVEKHDKSVSDDSSCAYRGHDGRKCGIGLLIPDELYHSGMEGERVQYALDNSPLVFDPPLPKKTDRDVLYSPWVRLQECHDKTGPRFHDDITRRLREFAEAFNLVIPKGAA